MNDYAPVASAHRGKGDRGKRQLRATRKRIEMERRQRLSPKRDFRKASKPDWERVLRGA